MLIIVNCEAVLFAFPLQNVDLDKLISPRHSELNSPPFLVKWNLGLYRQVCGRLQTQFSNFNLAQTEYKKDLSSFPFMNMFAPTDMLTWLDSFAN